jgi:hypothetical protein
MNFNSKTLYSDQKNAKPKVEEQKQPIMASMCCITMAVAAAKYHTNRVKIQASSMKMFVIDIKYTVQDTLKMFVDVKYKNHRYSESVCYR